MLLCYSSLGQYMHLDTSFSSSQCSLRMRGDKHGSLISYHAHWREASFETSQPSGKADFGAGSATVNVSSLLLRAMLEKLDPVR